MSLQSANPSELTEIFKNAKESNREKIYAELENLNFVDLKFVDPFKIWQHFTMPLRELTKEAMTEGVGFDGSSIRGFQSIYESDMLLIPDPETAFLDPYFSSGTISLICNVRDPVTKETYSRDPRYIAQKAEKHLKETGIADTSFWGPEAEFYIFDHASFDQNSNSAFYRIDSEEGIWNSGLENGEPNLGHRPPHKQGYFPVSPLDSLQDIRNEFVEVLDECGIEVEVHHHEVGTAGQAEIDLKYTSLVEMADKFSSILIIHNKIFNLLS